MAKTKIEQNKEPQDENGDVQEASNVGKEIVVDVEGTPLVVKIGDGYIVPDFADAMARAIEKNASAVRMIANAYYHRQIGGDALREACGRFRDVVFSNVK